MNRPKTPLRKTSRALHKWIGVLTLVYLALMGATGIGLNHPDWIDQIELPRRWLPGDYDFRNWNRNGVRGGLKAGDAVYLHGEAGVWRWDGRGGSEPTPLNEGLPTGAYRRDSRALLYLEYERSLLVGTRGGLYRLSLDEPGSSWRPVELGGQRVPVIDLARAEGAVLALTRSRLFAAPVAGLDRSETLRFADVTPPYPARPERGESLFRLIFEMHYGATWGWPGRLIADGVGLALVFFCVSGAWFWWRKQRKTLAAGRGGRWARKGLGWHRKLGLWAAPLVVFVALTGIFQRPPFLIAIADVTYDPTHHPGPRDPNPWHDKLRRLVYDSRRGVVTLSTSEGFYEGAWTAVPTGMRRESPRKAQMREKHLGRRRGEGFAVHAVPGGPPVSVMGATVLKAEPTGIYWVGSMSGLYTWDRVTGGVHDAFTREAPMGQMGKPTGENMVVARVDLDGSPGDHNWLWADYNRGLLSPVGGPPVPAQPAALGRQGRISLWHAMFEFHNGRLFGFLLGWWTWVVVPLGGLCLALVTLTGAYDRLASRLRRGRQRGKTEA